VGKTAPKVMFANVIKLASEIVEKALK